MTLEDNETPATQPEHTEEPPQTPPADEVAADELDQAIAELGPAPGSTPAAADEASNEAGIVVPVEDMRGDTAPSWPFGAYVGLWLAFAAFIVWRFYEIPADTALYEISLYRWVVIAGVAITSAGPVLALIVWLLTLRRPHAQKGALFASALFKGAISTFAGVSIWWASLLLLDQIRIGSLL